MQLADFSSPANGAYASLADLLALRFPAAQLKLARRNRALSNLAGPNKSNFRGRGIDFEEVRNYQPGDDIRTIDWRVTARTGNAHTKLFQEERERPVIVVVDQRSNMFFGSSHCFKSVLAAQLAGLIAWSALHNGDRVGGLVFNDAGHQDIRPRRSRKTVLALLSQVLEYNSKLPLENVEKRHSFADMIGDLRRIARPGSSLFIISDFRGADSEGAREQLFELAKHTEITALACSDPMEAKLPRAGSYTVTNGTDRCQLHTANRATRNRFQQRQLELKSQLSNDLLRLGIPLLSASTVAAPFLLLQTYYGDNRR